MTTINHIDFFSFKVIWGILNRIYYTFTIIVRDVTIDCDPCKGITLVVFQMVI